MIDIPIIVESNQCNNTQRSETLENTVQRGQKKLHYVYLTPK